MPPKARIQGVCCVLPCDVNGRVLREGGVIIFLARKIDGATASLCHRGKPQRDCLTGCSAELV